MKKEIIEKASELGFAAIGFTTAEPTDEVRNLNEAIISGRTAQMKWLARNPTARCDPRSLLPEAKSVICVALPYGEDGINSLNSSPEVEKGRARFARGDDYHSVVHEKLKQLWSFIEGLQPEGKSKICVDTSPIMEKALAVRAGLGWIGKNTILINEDLGSWLLLGEIITDLIVEPDTAVDEKCGDCEKCVKACPTGALLSPKMLDSRRCISYLTIESKVELPKEFERYVSDGQYGCDICQEVCPFNCRD
ncbi:MAG: tRNA epoxyqueuosine(34) reductase QueG [Deltaproteobacteria bacterium]|jgi:epoxyqueuosine reductase|nr:tRNA epoxyqueuosine(34) reductase QueG [Deltaproteobacteria bacterium]